MPDRIKLSKDFVFATIQGEGLTQGLPVVFVRTSGCPLSCTWCDASYTWLHTEKRLNLVLDRNKRWGFPLSPYTKVYNPKEEVVSISIDNLVEKIREVCAPHAKHVVFSGGEPLIWDHALVKVMEKLGSDYRTEIETAGIIQPSEIFDDKIGHYTVSLKLRNSLNTLSERYKPPVVQWFADNPKAWFKFVISAVEDAEEVTELVRMHEIPTDRVFLMPEGITKEELDSKSALVKGYCDRLGFKYSTRLHIELYGDKRGV